MGETETTNETKTKTDRPTTVLLKEEREEKKFGGGEGKKKRLNQTRTKSVPEAVLLAFVFIARKAAFVSKPKPKKEYNNLIGSFFRRHLRLDSCIYSSHPFLRLSTSYSFPLSLCLLFLWERKESQDLFCTRIGWMEPYHFIVVVVVCTMLLQLLPRMLLYMFTITARRRPLDLRLSTHPLGWWYINVDLGHSPVVTPACLSKKKTRKYVPNYYCGICEPMYLFEM